MGMIKPDAGRVLINGESPAKARKEGGIGYVPQSEDVDWQFPLSVRDVVMMGRYGHQGFTRRPSKADRAAVELCPGPGGTLRVRRTGRSAQLSGGQKKRAFVARGIAQGATMMLLDEPFAGVDKRSEATITRLLRELASDGCTILISTHDLHALPQLCDEAVLLMRKVLMHGPPELVLQPENLAMAFGLDVLNRDLPDEDAPDADLPDADRSRTRRRGPPGAGSLEPTGQELTMDLFDLLLEPLSYDFMVRAIVTTALAAIVCAVLSCWLVLIGWSLMGDAVSHAVLPGRGARLHRGGAVRARRAGVRADRGRP